MLQEYRLSVHVNKVLTKLAKVGSRASFRAVAIAQTLRKWRNSEPHNKNAARIRAILSFVEGGRWTFFKSVNSDGSTLQRHELN